MTNFCLKEIQRVMFAVKNGRLYVAPKNLRCSHKEWFKKEGWVTENDDTCMHQLVRGYVDFEGIYFYQGYDAHSPRLKSEALKEIIRELHKRLKLDRKIHIFFGTIQCHLKKSAKLPPEKDLGVIADIIKDSSKMFR